MTIKRIIMGNDYMQTIDGNGNSKFDKITKSLSDRELSGRRPDNTHPDTHEYVLHSSMLPTKLSPDQFGKPQFDPFKAVIPLYGREVIVSGVGKVKVLKAAEDNRWIQFIHPKSGEKQTVYGMENWELAQKLTPYDINDEIM